MTSFQRLIKSISIQDKLGKFSAQQITRLSKNFNMYDIFTSILGNDIPVEEEI